ncbi:Gfo/Idh/MocA family protein [Microbacterium aquimaris]|uniref:Gfo/Idh/MocA family oxidoreductase n=1 Tax=Microbacterium aquimaris TaxID=459816 RepID=A0ABU5N560_9MICO|nr:Gfo/Idh/MocA family oxidoreductase [Microbacterium aquimaris]MDZ8161211.1 Gfo/Idh/MocA family oxidoreductase [Microbacterium aquimaris]
MSRRVLVVGAGVMGHRHAAAVRAAGDRVALAVDADLTRARALDENALAYGSLAGALASPETVDAAIIATPSFQHLDQLVTLAAAGIPTLVEKPHRIPGQDPAGLLTAVSGGAEVFVGMSTRHWPGYVELTRAIGAGELGEIVGYTDRMAFALPEGALPAWYFDRSVSGGGVLVTNGVHALDRARALLGPLEKVTATMRPVLPGHDTEDHARVRFRAGTATGSIELLWAAYEPVATGLTVTGTRGAGHIAMDGSWRISTRDATRTGDAIDIDTVPFAAQWQAFRTGAAGFSIDDLEPTLTLIESLYREASDG